MAQRKIADSRIVITGASSGIGRALVTELARRGARLVITARREDRLRALVEELSAGDRVRYVVGDVTDEAVRQSVIDAAVDQFGGVDVLVNNAGIGALGRFESADPERLRRVMEVNFFAMVEMTRLALPRLKEGFRPMIVNISSILGHRAVPRSSEYCASKFAVQGFSESLRAELAGDGVDLLVVSPGTTQTDFFESVVENRGGTAWPEQAGVPATYVAARTALAMEHGLREIIPNRRGWWLCMMNRIAPRLVDRFMARYG